MAKCIVRDMTTDNSELSGGATFTVVVNVVIAASFFVTASTGLYFLFLGSVGFQGGHDINGDQIPLFSRFGWIMIHVWSACMMTFAAALHLGIHWGWVKKVTVRFFLSLLPQRDVLDLESSQPK